MRLTIVFMALSFLSVKTSVMCNEPKGEITKSRCKGKTNDSVKTCGHFIIFLLFVLCNMQVSLDIFVFLCLHMCVSKTACLTKLKI